ncbi:MAG: SDR family oxidoreductase [Chloroflexi bacterium]|nr:SDR family oxidoreductase [Chloroflexota bacterium]
MGGLVEGAVAVVTGGGRGIGRAACLELARHGADVAVVDIDPAIAAEVADEVRALGRRALAAGGDVTRESDRLALLTGAERVLGPIDILVNNAGIVQIINAFALTEADWDRMLDVNTKAVFFLCQAALPSMMERGRGAIVNVASTAGKRASGPLAAHYNASKAAVIAITRTWARIAAPRGVRVNCVCPGYIATPMWEKIDREMAALEGKPIGQPWREALATVPLQRGGTPDDVGRVIAFLASGMAGYMTGQAVNISGGLLTE